MTTSELHNLWAYIDSLHLKKIDREWLAYKLLQKNKESAKTARQKAYVNETLTRALNEVKEAEKEGKRLKTLDEFLEELRAEKSL